MEERWEETHRVLLHATADERVAGVSARARPTSARRRVASRRLPPFPPSNVYSDPAVEGPCSPVAALQRGELGAAAGGMGRRAQVIGDGRLWMEVVVATRPVGQRWMRPGVGLWPIWPSSIARSGGQWRPCLRQAPRHVDVAGRCGGERWYSQCRERAVVWRGLGLVGVRPGYACCAAFVSGCSGGGTL
jgi:hypothetical protein